MDRVLMEQEPELKHKKVKYEPESISDNESSIQSLSENRWKKIGRWSTY